MGNIDKALHHLKRTIDEQEQSQTVTFEDFLRILSARPELVVRNIFQTFHDMIHSYVGAGRDEYPDDPESINYVDYDCSRLFVENTDHPFFADRLLANRLINHVDSMKTSMQQNKLYVFEGPPGSGKSTFLNNVLLKFEEYANSDAGTRYEVVWRLDRRMLARINETQLGSFVDRLSVLLDEYELGQAELAEMKSNVYRSGDYVELCCPSHDNPLLMIPKKDRRQFFDDLFKNDEFKWKLFTEKEYEWVFREKPCTICSSIFEALRQRLPNPMDIFRMIHARPYRVNRRLGEGITVFNPGDKPMKQNVIGNEQLQKKIDALLGDSNAVRYIHSSFASTNNGIYALMDVKSHNAERLMELHNIISEGIHKVEQVEENVRSLFIALMNPEDEKAIEGFKSFSDRIEFINVPYVMDLHTEVDIYRHIFGRHIDESFLPRVIHNFARLIIATRMNSKSEAMLEWIEDPSRYAMYCDENLLLLKMEIYAGHIPPWLTEEDRKRLNAKRRRRIIDESESEGVTGFSGRDSIKLFGEFYSANVRKDKLITMSSLGSFFKNWRSDLIDMLPPGFLDSLVRNYDYTVLQEVKEALYYFNEQQISRDILNYMFAVNFENGSTAICNYTGEKLEISNEFLCSLELRFLGPNASDATRIKFRSETQKEYASRTLTQEIMVEGKEPVQTNLYKTLHEHYVNNLKDKSLEPFLDNENFRRAIKDFGTDSFKTYDQRIRNDVTFLIGNLGAERYRYTSQSAREMCVYVIDNDLARRFS
ncbi:MAG TPA: serine protein kinase PrkA [Deltaproteobacteria bacterium]|nr:serine protein kinase PrkA [Deltaproteobacteria bacterium]HQB38938.1 serine protein kinase PrkA [Deltaproteobacteria bacterium]